LQKGEKTLLVTHKSWIALIGPTLLSLTMLVIGLAFPHVFHYTWVLALLGPIIFLFNYADWKVNIWVVTSFRVIDEMGLMRHFAKESPLDKINNVSYDQSIWGRILNFGHVKIQTAAQIGATDYFHVNHPKRLKDTITQAQADLQGYKLKKQAEELADAIRLAGQSNNSNSIAAEIQRLFELKQKGAISEQEYQVAKNKLINL
jgi:uncharacterized membrane protein YdbT with pleckstrin-like domain